MKTKMFRFVAPALICCAAVASPGATSDPSYVRYQLAGGDVRKRGSDIHDVRASYYLIYTSHNNGKVVDIVLTPDAPPPKDNYIYSDLGWPEPSKRAVKGVLPHLKNGTGVNIGDSKAIVQRKLGALPQEISDQGMETWSYYAVVTVGQGKRRATKNYLAEYVFYRDKLWGIHYSLGSIKGF